MDNLLAIVDYRMDNEIRRELNNFGVVEFIDSYKNENVYKSIEGHVDISLFYDGYNFVCPPEAYGYYYSEFAKIGLKQRLIKGDSGLNIKYPDDIKYNVFCNKKISIAKFENVDGAVLKSIEDKGLIKINVNQGYSNCSILGIDENSIITSDKGVYNIAKEKGIEVLLIDSGYIELEGMSYGFIGGATSSFEENILFFGNAKLHPDYKKIEEFINDRGKKVISLGNKKLYDYGSMYLVKIDNYGSE